MDAVDGVFNLTGRQLLKVWVVVVDSIHPASICTDAQLTAKWVGDGCLTPRTVSKMILSRIGIDDA